MRLDIDNAPPYLISSTISENTILTSSNINYTIIANDAGSGMTSGLGGINVSIYDSADTLIASDSIANDTLDVNIVLTC